MANPSSRRVPPPNPSQYYAVPQSPRRRVSTDRQYSTSHPTRAPSNNSHYGQAPSRGDIAQGVATGSIGAGYGPYAHNPNAAREHGVYNTSRFSQSESSTSAPEKPAYPQTTSTVPPYLWDAKDPDLDDALHNPDPIRDAALDRSFTIFSARGWANVSALVILICGILMLFAGYPIISFYRRHNLQTLGANFGGSNGTGQIPSLINMPSLIDPDTPSSAHTKVASTGKTWNLVFSDEFTQDGRTFWPGDDPFWEAVDLNYWPTGDLEWYNPQAITTKDGKLVITMTEQNTHNLNFQSGMLQSWNKFCFTTGILEVSISLPGSVQAPGFWPGAWAMGNLGRAGYGATTEGTWPYSYGACDIGTFPNQTNPGGNGPPGAVEGAPDGSTLSFLPGQRLSACTCDGSDHPGPSVKVGRNVPEIDIIEAQIDTSVWRGQASQSFQTAPFNFHYTYDNSSASSPIYNPSITKFNTYTGGTFQQALSAVSYIDSANYGGNGYGSYSFEWWSNPSHREQGYIEWSSGGTPTWKITAASLAGDTETGISNRLVPEEPMYVILNFGMAPSFQHQDFKHLQFPSQMFIDYVRVYQDPDVDNGVGCNPPNYPTTDYINNHLNAYTNPNLTTWAQAGYSFPRNSKLDGC
ncbi:glycoside hydrolase family 16 protein [Dentipellis sp. KUC8613]|nr:glycoside hydrolase family 16 protein [Dentipellis sp. KUC8613]